MDKFWSIFSMPLGLLLTFGPAFFGWYFLSRGKDAPSDKHQDRH